MLRHRRLLALAVAPLLAGLSLAPSAHAIEPPAELRDVCVDKRSLVHHVTSPGCARGETGYRLPQDRPFDMCAEIRFGELRRVTSATSCNLTKERPYTVPDSGAIYVCSGNVQGGTVLPRGRLRRVSDAAQCDPRGETPLVTPAAPDAVADAYSIGEDLLLDVPAKGVLINDRDITGAPLTARLVSSVERGTLALSADGSLQYDPRGEFDGLDEGERATQTFRYLAHDGELDSAPATATITIVGRNDAPVSHADAYEVGEDDVLRVPATGVLANDTDAEGHPLTAILVSDVSRGELGLNADGSFAYDPAGAFDHLGDGEEAIVSFTYLTRDGSADSAVARATITVTGENDPPVTGADALSTDENTVLRLPAPGLLGNDADAEGHALSAVVVSGPSRGALALAADGSLVFDPRQDFDGLSEGETVAATFTYRAVDSSGGSSAPTEVTISVAGISAPTAVDDVREIDEDHAIAVAVLGNDELRGGRITDVRSAPGTATLGPDGVVTFDPRGAFDNLQVGTTDQARVDYTLVNDEGSSSAAIRITVTGRNDAPTADPDPYEAEDDRTLEERVPGVLEGDLDPEGDALTAVLVAPPARGRLDLSSDGSFVFHPSGDLDPGETENVTFGYRARDSHGAESATATVTIRLSGANDPPVLADDQRFDVDEDAAVDDDVGTVFASDPDGDGPLTFEIVTQSPAGALKIVAATGELKVADPSLLDAETTPLITLSVRVTDDGGLSDTTVVRVNVGGVDEPPRPSDDTYRAVGNTELAAGGAAPQAAAFRTDARNVLANDGDPDGGGLSVVPATGQTRPMGPGGPAGRFVIAADGRFTYHPPRGFTGPDQFSYEVTDGTHRTAATVRVTVAERVWYVDGSRELPGDGTSAAPYADLGAVADVVAPELPPDTEAPGQPDAPGDTIYLFTGTGTYPRGVQLEDDQRLIGQGVALVLDGAALVPAGTAPRVSTTGTPAVTLGSGNHLRGLHLSADGASALRGADFGTLVAELADVRAQTGAALDLANGTVNATLGTVSSTASPGSGLALRDLAGTLRVTGATSVGTASGPGMQVTGGSADVTLASGAITGAAGGLRVDGGSGRLDVGTSITTTGGRSVWVSGLTAPASGCAVALRGAVTDSGQGLLLDANGAGARTCFSGRLTLQTASRTAFEARGGGTVSATGALSAITTTTGLGLRLAGVAIGPEGFSLRSISTNGAPGAIVVDGVSGGPVSVTGGGVEDSGGVVRGSTGSAVTVTDSGAVSLAGMRITQSTGHGLELTRATGVTLRQVVVEDSGIDAIRGTTVRDLVLRQGTILQRSVRHGLFVTDLLGESSLTESVLRSSRGAAHVRIVNTAATVARPAPAQDVLRLQTMRFEDSADTFVDVQAGTGSNLQLLVGVAGTGSPNFLTGGSHGVVAKAVDGGRLDVDVTRFSRDLGTGDAVALEAGGAAAGGASALLTFDVFDNNRDRGGRIYGTKGAAVRLTAKTGGELRGTVLNNELTQPAGPGVVALAAGGTLEAEIGSNQISDPGCIAGTTFTDRCVRTGSSCVAAAVPHAAGIAMGATANGSLTATLRSNDVTNPLGEGIVADVAGEAEKLAAAAVLLFGNRVLQSKECSLRASGTPAVPARAIGGRASHGALTITGGGNTVDLLPSSTSSGIELSADGAATTSATLAGDVVRDGDDGVRATATGGATVDVDVLRLTREGGTGDGVDVSAVTGRVDRASRADLTMSGGDETDGAGIGIRSVGGSAVRLTGLPQVIDPTEPPPTEFLPSGRLDAELADLDITDAGADAISLDAAGPSSLDVASSTLGGTLGGGGIAAISSESRVDVGLTDNVIEPTAGGGDGVVVASAGGPMCLAMAGNRSVVPGFIGFRLGAGTQFDLVGRQAGETASAWLTRNGNTGTHSTAGTFGTCTR